jgi:glutaredoxin
VQFVIYSKPGCHLCDEMKGVVRRVLATDLDSSLEEVDISNDPALLERYGVEIPVLMLDGVKVAKYRVTEADVRRMLRGRT